MLSIDKGIFIAMEEHVYCCGILLSELVRSGPITKYSARYRSVLWGLVCRKRFNMHTDIWGGIDLDLDHGVCSRRPLKVCSGVR